MSGAVNAPRRGIRMTMVRRALPTVRALATMVALTRLARGRRRRAPLRAPAAGTGASTISAVIPARDEAARIGPCLDALAADPAITEVVVVDDGSTDGTADVARARGARVVPGGAPPPGWVGKPWALQQGLEAARGDVVVSLDADTRPRAGLAPALAAELGDADLVTAGARFDCGTAAERLLHPSFLASLVYRFGPSDAPGGRVLANGQCTAVERRRLLEAGGYRAAADHMTDDVALARSLAARGWRVAFVDARELLEVDMHASGRELWREWGRSIALTDVTPAPELAADVALVWLVLAAPVLRLIAGRATALDRALLVVRWALLGALAPSYARRGAAFWLSPLADPATAVRLTWSAVRPPRRWRGRAYGARGRAAR
jgi:dolichol-phosphate mannosyltransferase